MTESTGDQPAAPRTDRWLGRFLHVREGEVAAVLWSFAYFFCLLCGCYVLRPVRDEMGVQAGLARRHARLRAAAGTGDTRRSDE